MSRIFDALQRVEADRTASVQEQPGAGRHGAGKQPAASSRKAAWWNGLIVGCVLGFTAASMTLPYRLAYRRTSAPALPVTERQQTPSAGELLLADVAEAPVQLAAEPASEAEAVPDPGAATGSARAGESPDDVLGAKLRELAARDSLTRSTEPIVPASSRRTFWVQVGAFKNRDNATNLVKRLKDKGHPAVIYAGRSSAVPWALKVGRYADRQAADAKRDALAREGFSGFVISDLNGDTRESAAHVQ